MPAGLLVVGLDAAESTLLERWSAEGRLPALARMMRAGTAVRLSNCLETLPGAVWPEITTGRSCAKVAEFFHPDQLRTGEARVRPLTREDIDPSKYYWSVASRAGRRVAVIDQVHTVRCPALNGIQLLEWGNHDRNLGSDSDPSGLLGEVRKRHGDYPIGLCDTYPDNRHGHERLLADLITAVERKSAALLDLISRERWDLFTCTFTESHCVGHHFWHYLDPTHPDHEADAPEELAGAIATVYSRLDRALNSLVEVAGEGATVLVVASHGMGRTAAGWQLLPEVLVRLGLGSDTGGGAAGLLRRMQSALRDRVPKQWVRPLQAVADTAPVRALQSRIGGMVFPFQSPRTRAAALPNNRVGAIRLNVKGREPFGSVEPGAEAEALLAELLRELLALENPESGERIVERVQTADEAFGRDHHSDVPDLLVVFRTDLGPLEACRSQRIGTVRAPARVRRIPRTGDHTPESRLWAAGPGIAAGRRLEGPSTLAVAPTVLELLGVSLPDWLDSPPLALRTQPT